MTTRADWDARVRQELAGSGPETLATMLPEGVAVPAFPPDDAADVPPPGVWPYARGAHPAAARPLNMTRVDAADAERLRDDADDDLRGGADALWIAGGAPAPDDVAAALRPAEPDDLLVAIDVGEDLGRAREIAAAIRTERRAMRIVVFASPFSSGVPADLPFVISTHAWHAAGAHAVLELAYAAATGVHALRLLGESGVDVASAAARVGFSISVGRDVLAEIAKLRALRLVWAKVLAAAGVDAAPAWLHAVTAAREMTRRGPWNNILRGTTGGFAALCGGVDAVTVLPFDAARGRPSREARRTARNTLPILRDECALAAVADPGGGAPALELLTDRFARTAWDRFRAIEAKGGMAVCLLSGEIRRELDAAAGARRALPRIGETEFPDPDDAPPGDRSPAMPTSRGSRP